MPVSVKTSFPSCVNILSSKFGLLTEDAAKTDPQHSDPSWVKTWRNIKPIMDNFLEYLPNPYLQYYPMPNQSTEHQNLGLYPRQ